MKLSPEQRDLLVNNRDVARLVLQIGNSILDETCLALAKGSTDKEELYAARMRIDGMRTLLTKVSTYVQSS